MAAAAPTEWKTDASLENNLRTYVAQNLKRSEILDYLKKYYSYYPWSIATLDRRLRYFGINYIDKNTPIDVATCCRILGVNL